MRYLCILSGVFCIVLAEQETYTQLRDDGTVCSFMDKLEREEWDEGDKPCLDATLEMLNGVKNSTLWATWIWDSMQRPTGFLYGSRYQLGSFDQCMKPPWLNSHPHLRTQYCLVDIHLTNAAPKKHKALVDPNVATQLYVNTESRYGLHLNLVTWGVCFSSRCSPHTISKLVQMMHRTQHLPRTGSKDVKVHSCQIAGDEKEFGFGLKAFMWTISLLVSLTLFSTQYLRYVKSDTLLTRSAKAFCLKRNLIALIRTSKDNIGVLDGMRFTSAIMVVAIHYIAYCATLFLNGLDLENSMENALHSMVLHLDIAVDTFLVMSGLLLVQSVVRHNKIGKLSLIRMLWLRYVRLMGPQLLMVFYFAYVSVHVGGGPLWPYLSDREAEDCANYWWKNLFLINNYLNISDTCFLVSWYNSCVYQLTIFGTLLYCIYQRNRRIGLTCFAVTFLLSLLLPALATYRNSLPSIIFHIIKNTVIWKEGNQLFLGSYIQSHHRAGVFIMGMALGHFMTLYKPVDYRKIIPMKWSVPGALTALLLMERVLSLGAAMIRKEYEPLEAATYVVANRVIWAFAICALIVFCEYGTVPVISKYFRFQFMVPMGRLSYGSYIVHMAVIHRVVGSLRSPLSYDVMQLINGTIGVVVISFFVSFLIWNFIEAPITNITKVLLDTVSQTKTPDCTTNNRLENKARELTKLDDRVKTE